MTASNTQLTDQAPTQQTLASMVEVQLTLVREQAEPLAEALLQYGALSVGFADAHANTEHEQELFGEPGFEDEQFLWDLNLITVLFRNAYEAQSILKEALILVKQEQPELAADLQCLTEAVDTGAINYVPVPLQDWVRLTQAQFEPIAIHPKLTITPSWHNTDQHELTANSTQTEQQKSASKTAGLRMILDPGLAFGTGSHPTTALCLRWLCEQEPLPAQQTVLDYGCGSGILAIAAMQLGASSALGVDIDPQALISTQTNAANNSVLVSTALPNQLSQTLKFDCVLANILSGPLKVLAPLLCSKVKVQGKLVLSGILERQAKELIESYAPWINLQIWAQHDGWVCLVGQRLQS